MAERLVLDAGGAVRAVLPGPDRERYSSLLAGMIFTGIDLVAPALWAYETVSAVTKALYFSQLTAERGRDALKQLQDLGVHLYPPTEEESRSALAWTVRLKRVAAYDSYYLALAERLGCDFWTADDRLVRAVGLPWVRSLASYGG